MKIKNNILIASLLIVVLFIGVSACAKEETVDSITLWTTEEQPERIAVQEGIADRFKAMSGIAVEVVPVSENQMGERVAAALSAGDLPDVIYTPLNNVLPWVADGVLDVVAADESVSNLGASTYSQGVLDLVEVDGEYAAVPVDGWAQLLVYRKDLFDQNGLAAPNTYANILRAARTLHNPPDIYGFVAATDPSQGYMMQVFEFVGLANGVELVDADNNVAVDKDKLVETLEFYKELVDLSPDGNLYWQQSRELYLGGNAAMIIWSPFIMDELAGLRDEAPVTFGNDPTSDELAKLTGYLTSFAGPSNSSGAGWADVRYFGITVDAATEEAQAFVEYSLDEGLIDTLSIAPEGKFPIRAGTSSEPNKFVEGWKRLSVGVDRKKPLADIYSDEVIQSLIDGLENGTRWGFQNGQGGVTSTLYETRAIIELLREYLDGNHSASEVADLMIEEVDNSR